MSVTFRAMTGAEVDALIGVNLLRLRVEAGLGLIHAAARLQMDPTRLETAEAGKAQLDGRELLVATRVFRCGLNSLFAQPEHCRVAS